MSVDAALQALRGDVAELRSLLLELLRAQRAAAPESQRHAELIEALAASIGVNCPRSSHAILCEAAGSEAPKRRLRVALDAMGLIDRVDSVGHALGALARKHVTTSSGLRVAKAQRDGSGRLWEVTRMPIAD